MKKEVFLNGKRVITDMNKVRILPQVVTARFFAPDIFNLSGKITEKHAEEIDEILETLLERANRAGALKMLKYISNDQGWEESEEFYKNKIEEICKK